MAVGYAVNALNRPGWIRKAQQVFTARFALAARRPLRRLPPSPGWTWRCALRKANGRKSLREYPRRSGVYAAPNGSATALPKLVLCRFSSSHRPVLLIPSLPVRFLGTSATAIISEEIMAPLCSASHLLHAPRLSNNGNVPAGVHKGKRRARR